MVWGDEITGGWIDKVARHWSMISFEARTIYPPGHGMAPSEHPSPRTRRNALGRDSEDPQNMHATRKPRSRNVG